MIEKIVAYLDKLAKHNEDRFSFTIRIETRPKGLRYIFEAVTLSHVFLASWWAAYLGKDVGRVIQPTKLFDGKLLEREGDENFYG